MWTDSFGLHRAFVGEFELTVEEVRNNRYTDDGVYARLNGDPLRDDELEVRRFETVEEGKLAVVALALDLTNQMKATLEKELAELRGGGR